ncbi:MAG: HDOD domain-containing protein [Nitrospirae bacterium]|nr:HDOD domain-containing protein [Nitrospirota bacterium]
MEASEIRRAIEKLDSLSTIPVVLTQIIRATNDPDASPEDLYNIINRDPAIAARVLKMANSPIFGHSGKIGEIEQAIILLGYDRIRNIAVNISVVSMFSRKGDRNLRNFWAHSFEVAFIAAYIAEGATIVNSQVAFLAGLLHDVGRLIFYKLYRDQYRLILGTDDLLEKETNIFGCDHAEAGSWFAKKTKLPMEQVLAIQYHHAPSQAKDFTDIVAVVSLAEALSRRYSPKIEDDGIWTGDHDAILLELGLTNEDLEEIGEKLGQEVLEIQSFLELL